MSINSILYDLYLGKRDYLYLYFYSSKPLLGTYMAGRANFLNILWYKQNLYIYKQNLCITGLNGEVQIECSML